MTHEKIIILDCGSQYTSLLGRRLREQGVYSEILPYDLVTLSDLNQAKGIILSGSPQSVVNGNPITLPSGFWELPIPILGVCYGMQLMAHHYPDGEVSSGHVREYGRVNVTVLPQSQLFENLTQPLSSLEVWMSHQDKVSQLPSNFISTAWSKDCEIAAMEHIDDLRYAIQFHPEVSHTPLGGKILQRFAQDICGCSPTWKIQDILQQKIQRIRDTVGQDRVLLALSGGVDSSVTAALISEAIGSQLSCVFVDTGLMRQDEALKVEEMFKERSLDLKIIKAQERFFMALKGISDPEQKRKIIGGLFIKVFEEEAPSDVKWLAQGTIYPDVIESAGNANGKGHTIKSHHNVAGLPEHMNFKLLEPLRDLFKDEVRKLGVTIGLPEAMVYRHPFPGPGLAVRILGEVKPEFVTILQQADYIFMEELVTWGLYNQVDQAFAVFVPVKTVGVKGDQRCYDYLISLRAVKTDDYMTARSANLPYEFLGSVSRRITNEVPHISRVVYDISDKPPATIEWE